MNIGDRVKRLRNTMGLSQAALATRANMSQSALCQIENNMNGATGETLVKLAEVFGCSVDELLGRDQPNQKGA